jgi:hypothetical protein
MHGRPRPFPFTLFQESFHVMPRGLSYWQTPVDSYVGPGMLLGVCISQVWRWRANYVSVRFSIWLATSPARICGSRPVRAPPTHLPKWQGGWSASTGTGIRSQAIWFVLTWLSQWLLLNCVRNVVEDASLSDSDIDRASSFESCWILFSRRDGSKFPGDQIGKVPRSRCDVPSATF